MNLIKINQSKHMLIQHKHYLITAGYLISKRTVNIKQSHIILHAWKLLLEISYEIDIRCDNMMHDFC